MNIIERINRVLGRVPRGWPLPVVRPEGYAIAGEQWCGYLPPEPMTHAQAEEVRYARDRIASDEAFGRMVAEMRARRAGATFDWEWP